MTGDWITVILGEGCASKTIMAYLSSLTGWESLSAALSAEQQLRGPDKTVAAAGVVETLTEPEARTVAADLRQALGAGAHVGVYRLFCALDRADLDR